MAKEKKAAKKEADTTAKKKKPLLILLDAHAIIHRAYHALPDFASSKGEPTGALYGIVSMLLKIVKDLKPDYIAACYDLPGPTFRHAAYEKYKAERPKGDPALIAQIIRSRDIFTAFGIPMYDAVGFEADDVLGTIAEKLKKEADIIIASGDMDTLQLVDDKRVRVYTLKKGINDTILYDEDRVMERFGFGPELLPDFKGLRGDPSDNIIGIAGIGEKTATLLIKEFGTIEAMYKALKKEKERFKKAGCTERIVKLLEDGEEEALFSKTLAQIRKDAPVDFKLPDKPWLESVDPERAQAFLREIEFKSLAARTQELLGGVKEETSVEAAAVETATSGEIEKAKIALWLIDSEKTNPDTEDVLAFAKKKTVTEALPALAEELSRRGLTRVYEEIELPLIPVMRGAEERGILVDKKHFEKLSVDFHKKLSAIEARIWKHAGGEFNINSPRQLGEVLFDKMGLMAKGVRMKKTEGGARSTRISELEKLRGTHPIIEDIMEYREFQKLLSTYIDAIPPLLDAENRLHSHFIQTGASTGRFASTNPNLQNIPASDGHGTEIRKGFIAGKGHLLLSFDYSQIELRVAAILSGDKNLTQIFREGKDVHAAVAARVFKVKEADVTNDMRRKAKVINFGIVYGMGVSALRENLGSSRAEAEEFYENYLKEFSGLAAYMESVKRATAKNGYTETLFGRRRYFPGIRSGIPYVKAMTERMATNAPLQGTAADIIKLAIRYADEDLKAVKLGDKAHLLLQIHDELIYEVEEGVVPETEKLVTKAMAEVIERSFLKQRYEVPLLANSASGKNWGEL